ncbi:hypothetical protein ACFX13_043281 [Malus domestica]
MWCLSQESLPSPKTMLSAAASLAASAILFKTIANDLIPEALQTSFYSHLQKLSSQLTVVVEEIDGLTPNKMFETANLYLGAKVSAAMRRIKVNKPEKDEQFLITIDKNQGIVDSFNGVDFKWVLISTEKPNSNRGGENSQSEVRLLELSFHKKQVAELLQRLFGKDTSAWPHVAVILPECSLKGSDSSTIYLYCHCKPLPDKPCQISFARQARHGNSSHEQLHTVDYNGTDYWRSINLDHPASFETTAMEPEMKAALVEDLERFRKRNEYYMRVGKDWKRGYFLYGLPGMGKSSLVDAMANYLKFDIFDLDLREVQCNSDLRRLLIGTKSRSILVIEDIDCSVELQNRDSENKPKAAEDNKISISAILNFIDGLWSTCEEERIVVGFKTLAYNYLLIHEHTFFGEIEMLLDGAQATPAEVAGELMKSDDAHVSLQGLIEFLRGNTDRT